MKTAAKKTESEATAWRVGVHPFCPGMFCVRRVRADGRSEHLTLNPGLSGSGIEAFYTRQAAAVAAISANAS